MSTTTMHFRVRASDSTWVAHLDAFLTDAIAEGRPTAPAYRACRHIKLFTHVLAMG